MKTSKQAMVLGTAVTLVLVAGSVVAFAQTPTLTTGVLNPASCSTALDAQNTAAAPAIDAKAASEKAAFQARTTELKAAVAMTDQTQRAAAVRAAEQKFRQAMLTAMKQYQTSMQTTMQAVRTSCGGLGSGPMFGFGGGHDGKFEIESDFQGEGRGMMGRGGERGMMRGRGGWRSSEASSASSNK